MITEFSRGKNPIVGVICLDRETSIFGSTCHDLFATNRLFSSEVCLRVVEDLDTGMVNIQGPTDVAFSAGIATKRVNLPSSIRADEVVTQDALSGIEVIAAKSRTRLGVVARHLGGC